MLSESNLSIRTCAKTLSLCFGKGELAFTRRDLCFAIVCSWVAGIGRYWDHPDPAWWQRLGIGSVIYIFALGALLWLLFAPMRLKNLSYIHLVTLIGMTAPLAFLYAVPVERFVAIETAQSINAWFLAIVALWRVAIYFRYLIVYLESPIWVTIVVGLLPLCGIVTALASMNLEKAVFQIMAGLHPAEPTAADGAYQIVVLLTALSTMAAPFLGLGYVALVLRRCSHRGDAVAQQELPPDQS